VKDIWITREEVQELTGWSRRCIFQKAHDNKIVSRYAPGRAKNGRREREYLLSSLPPEFHAKRMNSQLAARKTGSVHEQQSLFIDDSKQSMDSRLALTAEQREQAQRRLSVLQPLLGFFEKRKRGVPYVTADGLQFTNSDLLAAHIAANHGKSKITIWRWHSNYDDRGFAGLADRARDDKGISRFFAKYPKAAQVVQAKYLKERLSIQLCYEALSRDWPTLYNHGSQPPSYTTVREFLQRLPKPVVTLAREGDAAFREKCSPYLVRKIEATFPNQIWVSDHGKHDVWVRNDGTFSGVPVDAAIRPWLTAIIDMRSRKIVGAIWSSNPSSHTISSALRMAIVKNGIPDTLYIDNGKDFESIGRIDISPEASGVLHRLGIASQYCIPKHPQSKLIESWFSTVRKRFDSMWEAFYCGSSPDQRSEACHLALRDHKKFLDGKIGASPLPNAKEFITLARQWVFDDYNQQYVAHSGRGMDGRTPEEVFSRELPPKNRRALADLGALDELFWKREKRVVQEGGCVNLFSSRYEPADPQSGANLFLMIGREIAVACDPDNVGDAIAIDPAKSRVIGRLVAQKLVMHGPTSHEDIKARFRLERTAKRAIKNYVQGIAVGVTTEVDHMRKRARLPQTIQGSSSPTLPARRVAALNSAAAPQYVEDVVDDIRALMEGD
jgi:transposase InsO family protein